MDKRVLYNLHWYDPSLEPYWAFVPANLVHPAPRPPPIRPPSPPKDSTKAFANPLQHGYGGGEAPWPFDHNRAYHDGRYRAGIRNAIKSDWTAQHWKYYAALQLHQILNDLIADGPDRNRYYINESNYGDMIIHFRSILF